MDYHLRIRVLVVVIILIGNLGYGADTILSLWEDSSIFLEYFVVLGDPIIKSQQSRWNLDVLEKYLITEAELQGTAFYKDRFSYEELRYVPLPAILPARDNKSFSVLLAVLEVDKQLRFQSIWGGRQPRLLNITDTRKLFGSEPVEAWLFFKEPGEGVVRKIGNGAVHIDKLYHNFNFITIDSLNQPLQCSFHILNVGENSLRLGQIQKSCRCTLATFEPNNIIAPGIASELTIHRTPPGQRTLGFRDRIAIQIEDMTTQQKGTFIFEILGNCDGQTIFPVPETVNFGRIKSYDKVERIVRLSESNAEKFSITDIKSDNSAFKTKIDKNRHDNLRDYIIHIYLESAELLPGKINGEILIKTNHPRFAEFRIPVNVEILPQVRAIPSVLSWGIVKLGSYHKKSLQLKSIDDKTELVIEKIYTSNDINISKKKLDDNTFEIEFGKLFDHLGSWQENVILHVRYSGKTTTIKIPLVGFVEN